METITSLPLSALRESPFNPRQIYPEADLQELAQSIKSQGVMQPIVVRAIANASLDEVVRYEIVFGHLRKRAAALAGLDTLPSIVRDMDDQAAAIAQVHENTQRADVTAMEEADSFAHLHKAHGLSADAIAAAVAKSKSYVYGRLKLASAAPEVRKACTEQCLSPETALDLARLPQGLQRIALKAMRDRTEQTTAWLSVRDARRHMATLFNIRLAQAPFDLADADLYPFAGACTKCSQRAGNIPDLDTLPADTCINADCHSSKSALHREQCIAATHQRIAQWRAQGGKVIDAEAAREIWPYNYPGMLRGYVSVDDDVEDDDGNQHGTFAAALATMPDAPATVLIHNPHDLADLRECIASSDVEAVYKHLGINADPYDPPQATQATRAAMADWTPAERLTTDRDAWLEIRKAAIINAAAMPRSGEDLRLVLKYELQALGDFGLAGRVLGWKEKYDALVESDSTAEEIYDQLIDAATTDQCAALLLGLALDELLGTSINFSNRDFAAQRVALAQRYGVAVAPAEPAAAEAEPSPTSAAPAPTVAAGKPQGTAKAKARYVDEATGMTWSGRGMQPKWLKVALSNGKTLADFDTTAPAAESAAQTSACEADAFDEAAA